MADNANYAGVFRGIPVINGDIFESGADIIAHQVNCQGVMGSGVAKQVREKYPSVFKAYKMSCDIAKDHTDRLLGSVQYVCINPGEKPEKHIVNLFAQDKFGYDGNCYTDYEALEKCLKKLNEGAKGKTVAIPFLMACHRGGGDWDIVSRMIMDTLTDCDVTFYRYMAG